LAFSAAWRNWKGPVRAHAASSVPLARVEGIARRMTYIDLMTNPKYMDEFVSASFIPHTDIERFPSVAAPPRAVQETPSGR